MANLEPDTRSFTVVGRDDNVELARDLGGLACSTWLAGGDLLTATCTTPSAELASFSGLPAPTSAQTTRERYEAIHTSAGTDCPGCHVQFDPIGFGFEHFDEVGRYRATENSLPIDAVSYVPDESGNPLFEFDGQEALVEGLAGVPTVGACVSGQLTTWVFGGTWACLGEARRDDETGRIARPARRRGRRCAGAHRFHHRHRWAGSARQMAARAATVLPTPTCR